MLCIVLRIQRMRGKLVTSLSNGSLAASVRKVRMAGVIESASGMGTTSADAMETPAWFTSCC